MTPDRFEMPDETWKRAAVGGVGGGVGFFVAEATVGGGNALQLAVATGVAALVVMVLVTAALNTYAGRSAS